MKVQTALCVLAVGASASGVVKHNLRRIVSSAQTTTGHARGVLNTELDFVTESSGLGAYYITVDVGTPPQSLDVMLDTGSSDLWLPSSSAAHCLAGNCPRGSFSAPDSSTHAVNTHAPSVFEIGYAEFTSSKGNYSLDTVRVGGASLKDFTFGLADDWGLAVDQGSKRSTPIDGIMGLDFEAHQVGTRDGNNFSSPTIPLALKQQGYIGSQSYSIYIDDAEAGSGHVLFGGIDTAKYIGELHTLAGNKSTKKMFIEGTGFAVSHHGRKQWQTTPSNFKPYAALLDTGVRGMDIPRSVWEYITSHVPGELVDQAWEIRGYLVACSTRDEPITLTASFRGMNGVAAEVEMPFRHMLVPALESLRSGNYNDTAPLVIDGTEQCVFTPTPVDDDFGEFGIGDPVFRSSYVFFNMEEYTISLAPASYNTDESNLVPIGEGDGRTGNYPSGLGSKKGVARPWWA